MPSSASVSTAAAEIAEKMMSGSLGLIKEFSSRETIFRSAAAEAFPGLHTLTRLTLPAICPYGFLTKVNLLSTDSREQQSSLERYLTHSLLEGGNSMIMLQFLGIGYGIGNWHI